MHSKIPHLPDDIQVDGVCNLCLANAIEPQSDWDGQFSSTFTAFATSIKNIK